MQVTDNQPVQQDTEPKLTLRQVHTDKSSGRLVSINEVRQIIADVARSNLQERHDSLTDAGEALNFRLNNFPSVFFAGQVEYIDGKLQVLTFSEYFGIQIMADKNRLAQLRPIIENDPFSVLCLHNVTGDGLNIVLQSERIPSDDDEYRAFYQQGKTLLRTRFDLTEDELSCSSENPAASCFLSYDPGVNVAMLGELYEVYPTPAEEVQAQLPEPVNKPVPSISFSALLSGVLSENKKPGQETKETESTAQTKQEDNEFQLQEKPSNATDFFPDEIFEALPQSIKTPCDVLVSATEREVFIVGTLGVVSGLLPNVYGLYDGKNVGANLYAYVLAPYGTGKGALTYAYQLGVAIHRQLREQGEKERQDYEADCSKYEKELTEFKKSKSPIIEPPTKPAPPKNTLLYIPANNSKTGFMQLLDENGQRGVLFEAEGDTLADAVAQDYGNFSDALRCIFHHERVSYNRRGNGGEYVEMESPRLSVAISSTPDQLLKLIPTAANGLFSRFLYYNTPPDPTFRNVFDRRKRQYEQVFKDAGEYFLNLYNCLLKRGNNPIEVQFTEDQEVAFVSHFSAAKASIYNEHDENLGGTVNRLALICFRLCMIFTTLRAFESGEEPATVLVCSDEDFKNATAIIDVLTRHALIVYELLPRPHNAERKDRDTLKYEGIKAAVEKGHNWDEIATQYGFNSKQAANSWYQRADKKFKK